MKGRLDSREPDASFLEEIEHGSTKHFKLLNKHHHFPVQLQQDAVALNQKMQEESAQGRLILNGLFDPRRTKLETQYKEKAQKLKDLIFWRGLENFLCG